MLGKAFVTTGAAPAMALAPRAANAGAAGVLPAARVEAEPTALERMVQGPAGPPGATGEPGPQGIPGESVPNAMAVAEVDIAAGQAVFIDLATRLMGLARADIYARRACIGLARSDVPAGQVGEAEGKVCWLADWTAATGAALLVPGRTYFLACAPGLLTLVPPDPSMRGTSIVRVGIASGPQTLALLHAPPILL